MTASQTKWTTWIFELAAISTIVLGVVLCILSLSHTGVTYDEPNYIHASLQVATHFTFELENTILHPPLMFLLNGYLLKWAPQADLLSAVHLARIVDLLLFFPITALLLYLWSRELFGRRGALVSTVLFAGCPLVLAHARLATTDMAACFTFFAAFFALWRLYSKTTPQRTLICGLALGLAFLAKYSTVLIVPIAIVVFLLAWGVARLRRDEADAGMVRCGRQLLALLSAAAVGVIVVLLAYGMTGAFQPLSELPFQSRFFQSLAEIPLLKSVPIPLPEPYLLGLDFQKQITETGFTSFLMGQKYYHGVWYYFPIGFLTKMPLPFILLLALGIAGLIRRRSEAVASWLFVLCPALLFCLYLTFLNTSNAGVRYALPAVPFFAVAAGACLREGGRFAMWKHAAVGVLCLWLLAGTILVHPYYLAYQNEAAGGPRNAFRIWAGSDLDWGQDRAAAVAYAAEQRGAQSIEPRPGALPQTGRILIGVNELHDCLRPREILGWLQPFEPADTIGYTYLLYTLTLDDFRSLARDNPRDPKACFALAGALLDDGRLKDCREEIDRGLALEPQDAELLFLEGILHHRAKQKGRALRSWREVIEQSPLYIEVYTPLRFVLLRQGLLDEARRVRRVWITNEIRLAHVEGVPDDVSRLKAAAEQGRADAAELCVLTVKAWLDEDTAQSLRYARQAVVCDPNHTQALGNLLFLITEHPEGGSYGEAKNLLDTLDHLRGRVKARFTPQMNVPGDRIVFGSILTFRTPSRAEVEARFVIQGRLKTDPAKLAATVSRLVSEGRLPEAQELLLAGQELFPDHRPLRDLEATMNSQESGL